MSGVMSALAGNTWAAIAATLGAFLTLFAGLQVYSHTTNASPESTRKMFHTGSGVLTLTFPFLFQRTWPVLLLTGVSALLISSVKFLPALRHRFGHVTDRVDRPTLGEVYFPIAVAVLFWLTRESNPLLYVIPIMMLTFADATGALVGRRYGMTPYVGAAKSLEGSVAFVAVAYFCVHVPLLLWSSVGRTEVLLIAATLASLVMLLEGSAWRGLDNLFIPIGGYLLLRAYLPLDAAALFPRFLVTVGLVVLVIIARHRTTLEDDSLLTGAFLCYVAWSVMGWRWLVGPLAITIGYRWLSPPTADNSRRIHEVPAVLSVWAPAIGWLALSSRSGNVALLFPYTVAFGAHLAMFGTSRLGRQFPAKPLATMFWRAVMISWAIVIVPYVLITGAAISNLVAALGAMGAIAIGSAAFVGAEPDVRNAPQTTRRWLYQAVAAGIASAGAWGVAAAASGWTTR